MRFALAAPGFFFVLVSAVSAADTNGTPSAIRSLSQTDILLLGLGGALVFFMQAGFAFLESGFARAKNAVNVLLKNYLDMCFGAVAFWAIGYGLMFGFNPTGWFGQSHYLPHANSGEQYMHLFFQMMFAATAATIVSGAIAERTHFRAYIFGSIIITALIYPVFGAWVWGGWYGGEGWLAKLGFVDFAGSTVVHSLGGWCALAALIIIKPRLGRYGPDGSVRDIPGHNMSSAALGALILWLGWFGFNGASIAASTEGTTANLGRIILNTHLGGAGGAIGAVLTMVLFRNKVLLGVTLNGSISGLVAVTAGCHVMDPGFALLTGLISGFLTSISEALLLHVKIDDVVGAVSVHLVGGIWGTIAVGLFKSGDLFSIALLEKQLIGIAVCAAWAFPLSLLMYWLLNMTVGLRASALHEQRGLDFSEHAEVGYPEFQQEILHSGKTR